MRGTRWHRHPGVRTGGQLSTGERAADKMRNGMGSWGFVFAAVGFLIVWMTVNKTVTHYDPYPFILLNLVLSCVAALQGAILLIAAKRSDQVSSELAEHDFDQDIRSREMLDALTAEFSELKTQHAEQGAKLDQLVRALTPTVDNSTDVLSMSLDNDGHRALALCLQRLGGRVDLTEAEVREPDQRGVIAATRNRVEGSVTLEYRRSWT